MSDLVTESNAKTSQAPRRPKRRRGLLILGAVLLLLLGGGAGAYFFLPGAADGVKAVLARVGVTAPEGGGSAPAAEHQPAAARSTFVSLPEITLTLPNAGRPRQLRITLAIEVGGDPALVQPTVVSPRVFDSLILYLRTLRDGELEGALAIDRLRGDLYRRLDLLLGPNVVRDVLITGFVVA